MGGAVVEAHSPPAARCTCSRWPSEVPSNPPLSGIAGILLRTCRVWGRAGGGRGVPFSHRRGESRAALWPHLPPSLGVPSGLQVHLSRIFSALCFQTCISPYRKAVKQNRKHQLLWQRWRRRLKISCVLIPRKRTVHSPPFFLPFLCVVSV